MKRIAIAVLLAIMSMPAFAAQQENVDICHFDLDYGAWKLISISGNAIEKHFENHDDGLPESNTLGTVTPLDENCEATPVSAEPSCVDGIINQDETGFQYKFDTFWVGGIPDEPTGTECGGPHCAPCFDESYIEPSVRYDACVTSAQLASCTNGGAGHPVYNSFACTANSCVCESYNPDLTDSKGYWFDAGANNYAGDYIIQKCDSWISYCEENEYADYLTGSCQSCPAGTTRRAGDDPLRDQRDETACTTGG